MSQFNVSPETIRTVAGQVSSGASELDAQRARLLTQIQGLGDTWQGSAAQALQSLYGKWDADVRALHNTLTEVAQAMQSAANAYETTNDSVRGTFAS